MPKDERPKLFELLGGEFRCSGDVLDVGFGDLVDLYELERSPFF